MTRATVRDIAYVRLSAPDLEVQSAFLEDFGLTPVGAPTGVKRHFASAGPAPFCYELTEGPAALLGFGFWADGEGQLEAAASAAGTRPVPLDAPGGGRIVRLTDPDGFEIDLVAGQDFNTEPPASEPTAWNEGMAIRRVDSFRRTAPGPSRVQRLGHLAIAVSDFARSERWYKDHFGLLTSDEFELEPGTPAGAFLRIDRGSEPADHHTLVLFQSGKPPALRHVAFEVAGVDDLMVGREHLLRRGHTPHWGVGRHLLGSQVFDYWLDPYGREHEHWTDGDQLRADHPPSRVTIDEVMGIQWGMERPGRL